MSLKNNLYSISRILNKTAGILNDIETIATGNPKKIAKRAINKSKNKLIYKTANKISRKTNKK